MERQDIYRELVEYLGGPTKAAEILRVKQGAASNWIKGSNGMSASTALLAEKVTDGKFKASDLNQKLADLENTAA